MKEIVVISGKGGTGKTSVTASLAMLGNKNMIVADCDVDAADMHLLMQPQHSVRGEFFSGVLAVIDQDKCIKCGKCAEICRWEAIQVIDDQYHVQPLDCEGCGYCALVCPVEAIEMESQNVGDWIISDVKSSTKMVHAKLHIGAENSGKLVAKVKNEAKALAKAKGLDYILVDGSPGVGCPVVSSLSGADLVVLVTEPSVSGIHDLKRVYELVEKFGIPANCIINKADINVDKSAELKQFLADEKIDLLAEIPFDDNFTKAMTMGQTIVEYDPAGIGKILEECWDRIK